MKLPQVPINKIGTAFQGPSWRYNALQHPKQYGLTKYLSKKDIDDASYLMRLIPKNLMVEITYVFPEFYKKVSSNLSPHLSEQLKKVWKKNHNKIHKTRVVFLEPAKCKRLTSWNIAKVDQLNDDWFKKLILHVMNYKYDESIDFALKVHMSADNAEMKRFIGFQMFAGLSDEEIVKAWKLSSINKVKAIRMLFFDFSYLPQNKIAQWSFIKQLAKDEEISQEDFAYYKRIYDLGPLGLSAQVSFLHLSPTEQKQIEQYLGRSAVVNMMNLEFSIRNTKDAMNYTNIINNVARMSLQQEMVKHKATEIELMKLNIEQVKKEMNIESKNEQQQDLIIFEEMARDMGKLDAEPKYIDFIELQQK
jgi:hypothetical protein